MASLIASVIIVLPVAGLAYYIGRSPKHETSTNRKEGDDGSFIPDNHWVYLESPIVMPKSIPGDGDQISLQRPLGTVQQAVSEEVNPIKALGIIADHEAKKDKAIVSMWTEFFKPTREIITRSVDQPITTVHILKPGTTVDKLVLQGNRFWDQPVPRSTGIDRYYKRQVNVPWYLVP